MSYVVDFRGYPACPCLAAWLPAYESELQRRRILKGSLNLYQLIGDADASGGTHSQGGAFDITDLPGGEDVAVARQMGADATWSRTPAQGFMAHIHGVLRGCPHNEPARYQITAVDNGGNGLGAGGMGGTDDGPRPLSGRTWREGIEWAEETAVADAVDRIIAAVKASEVDVRARINEVNIAIRDRDARNQAQLLSALEDLATEDDVVTVRKRLRELAQSLAAGEPEPTV